MKRDTRGLLRQVQQSMPGVRDIEWISKDQFVITVNEDGERQLQDFDERQRVEREERVKMTRRPDGKWLMDLEPEVETTVPAASSNRQHSIYDRIIRSHEDDNLVRYSNGIAVTREEFAAMEKHPVISASFNFPADYIPWKSFSTWLRSIYLTCHDRGVNAGKNEHETILKLMRYEFPFYLVSRGLLDMLEKTDALEGLSLDTDATLPFDAFMLLLPKGTLVLDLGGEMDVSVLTIYRKDQGSKRGLGFSCIRHDLIEDAANAPRRQFTASLGLRDDGTLMDKEEDFNVVFECDEKTLGYGSRSATQACLKIAALVNKLLAAMAAEPDLIEKGYVDHVRPAKKDKPRKEFRVPRYIGRRVTFRHEKKEHQGGTVIAHWRRGFMRRQHYGPKNSLTKIVRIAPILVNNPNNTQNENHH